MYLLTWLPWLALSVLSPWLHTYVCTSQTSLRGSSCSYTLFFLTPISFKTFGGTFYFEILLNLQKSCENNTRNSHRYFTEILRLLTVSHIGLKIHQVDPWTTQAVRGINHLLKNSVCNLSWPFTYVDSQPQIENATYFFPETFRISYRYHYALFLTTSGVYFRRARIFSYIIAIYWSK